MNEGLRTDSVAQIETRTQVMRLVSAGVLSADSRSLGLLEYLLRHWHEKGEGVPIKAYAIAVDVLGRGAEFDRSTDSIVRVEIGRLRKLLDFYYQGQRALPTRSASSSRAARCCQRSRGSPLSHHLKKPPREGSVSRLAGASRRWLRQACLPLAA